MTLDGAHSELGRRIRKERREKLSLKSPPRSRKLQQSLKHQLTILDGARSEIRRKTRRERRGKPQSKSL